MVSPLRAVCGSAAFNYLPLVAVDVLARVSGEGRSELRYAQRCAEFRELQSVERMAPHGSAVRYVWLGVLFLSSPADLGS